MTEHTDNSSQETETSGNAADVNRPPATADGSDATAVTATARAVAELIELKIAVPAAHAETQAVQGSDDKPRHRPQGQPDPAVDGRSGRGPGVGS